MSAIVPLLQYRGLGQDLSGYIGPQASNRFKAHFVRAQLVLSRQWIFFHFFSPLVFQETIFPIPPFGFQRHDA